MMTEEEFEQWLLGLPLSSRALNVLWGHAVHKRRLDPDYIMGLTAQRLFEIRNCGMKTVLEIVKTLGLKQVEAHCRTCRCGALKRKQNRHENP